MRSIPFLPEFREAVRSGLKTMTTRTKPYGKAGDLLQGPDCRLLLIAVDETRLALVANFCFSQEGFDSTEDFETAWAKIHPRRGYQPNQEVWLHRFQVVPEGRRGASSRGCEPDV